MSRAAKTMVDGRSHLSREALQVRAQWNARIRSFFAERDVIEVNTPVLSKAAVTDPALHSFKTTGSTPFYLQTSPEFAMKRLLASGSGDIYQIAQVFRAEEIGRWHQPEFACLEWYRMGWDHHALLAEVLSLFQLLCPMATIQRFSYQQMLTHYLGIAVDAPLRQLQGLAKQYLQANAAAWSRQMCLDALIDGRVLPHWREIPCVVLTDYPKEQAALAKIDRSVDPAVAMRFEVFVYGVECANGFCELNDPVEQRSRFEQENAQRQVPVPMDEALLQALAYMPDCAGVAVGLDRLFALSQNKRDLASILPLPH